MKTVINSLQVALSTANRGQEIPFRFAPGGTEGDVGVHIKALMNSTGMSEGILRDRFMQLPYTTDFVDSVVPNGSYLNIKLNRQSVFRETFAEIEKSGFSHNLGVGKIAQIEHTSINPNAEAHVGRGRNAIIGDFLARSLRFQKYDTVVRYYVNDIGKQIAYLVLQTWNKQKVKFVDLLAEYIAVNELANNDPSIELKAFELLTKFEASDPTTVSKFIEITTTCLNGHISTAKRLNIEFDQFDRESRFLDDRRIVALEKKWKHDGVAFTDEHGRIVADLRKLGFQDENGRFLVLRRANGSTMYAHRDIAYSISKAEMRSDIELIVLGEDHQLYQEQMSTVLSSEGLRPPEAIHYSFVILKDGKMSTRRGNVVLLDELLDEAKLRAGKRVDENCPGFSCKEREVIADKIAVGAVRFSMLKVSPRQNVVFDWDQALSFEGDSSPYIQYSAARIAAILDKYEGTLPPLESFEVKLDNKQWQLLLTVNQTADVILNSFSKRNPAIVANHALDLAKATNAFYNNSSVLKADCAESKFTGLYLCRMAYAALETTLNLLGAEIPQRM